MINTIIINADDFGYSYSVNRAILQSFQRSLCNSLSLMPNLDGFEDAIGLIKAHPILRRRVGIHVNLTEGFPLSDEIRHCSRFCDPEGRFSYRRERPLFLLSRRERGAVYEEIKMQLDRVIAAGIEPVHLDSHHHVHTEWAISSIVNRLVQEYHIGRVRRARNMGRPNGYAKRLYKALLHRWYFRKNVGFAITDYFGDIEDMKFLLITQPPVGKFIEVMVHPHFDGKGELVDINKRDLQQQLAPVLAAQYTISSSMHLIEKGASSSWPTRV
jgi:predicted glycoside hydrolase/deacetylase ChbG (UPF0249 family)